MRQKESGSAACSYLTALVSRSFFETDPSGEDPFGDPGLRGEPGLRRPENTALVGDARGEVFTGVIIIFEPPSGGVGILMNTQQNTN
jgi:hypothetical protein